MMLETAWSPSFIEINDNTFPDLCRLRISRLRKKIQKPGSIEITAEPGYKLAMWPWGAVFPKEKEEMTIVL